MITVQVKDGKVDLAIKKFKNKVAKSGLPGEVKRKRVYIKPGVERAQKRAEAKNNARKAAKRERNAA
ncbi:MAG: 30S ribosomal protein S21 [Tenericutes bacterium]|nr:30S ribosomal protein S21 [Mycoplasmatota bacterium]